MDIFVGFRPSAIFYYIEQLFILENMNRLITLFKPLSISRLVMPPIVVPVIREYINNTQNMAVAQC